MKKAGNENIKFSFPAFFVWLKLLLSDNDRDDYYY